MATLKGEPQTIDGWQTALGIIEFPWQLDALGMTDLDILNFLKPFEDGNITNHSQVILTVQIHWMEIWRDQKAGWGYIQ
jgi:hypothetical protein